LDAVLATSVEVTEDVNFLLGWRCAYRAEASEKPSRTAVCASCKECGHR